MNKNGEFLENSAEIIKMKKENFVQTKPIEKTFVFQILNDIKAS